MIQEFVLDEKEQRPIEQKYSFPMAEFSAFPISLLGTARDVGTILGSISSQFSGNGRFTSAKGFGRSRNGQTGSKKNACAFPFEKSKMMIMAHRNLLLVMSLNTLIITAAYVLFFYIP